MYGEREGGGAEVSVVRLTVEWRCGCWVQQGGRGHVVASQEEVAEQARGASQKAVATRVGVVKVDCEGEGAGGGAVGGVVVAGGC